MTEFTSVSQPHAYAEVTSVSQLHAYAEGALVELPPFGEGQPFVAKMRRPSMLLLAKLGKIPNALLGTANKLFAESSLDKDNENMLSEFYSVVEAVAEAAFIQPSYQEIKEAGLTLSDDQLMFIFNYTQQGIRALDTFRPIGANS